MQQYHDNPRRGIILTTQYSGSTWLVKVLDSHPSILWGSELLQSYGYAIWKTFVGWDTYWQAVENAFTKLKQQGTSSPKWIGFKLMYDQIPTHLRRQLFEKFAEENVTVIHLIREATILRWAHLAQRKQDEKDGIFVGKHVHLLGDSRPVLIDPGKAKSFVYASEATIGLHSNILASYRSNLTSFEVKYECLISKESAQFFFGLFGFLQVFPMRVPDLTGIRARLHEGSCSDRISNWEHVAPVLHGTKTLSACMGLE